MMDRYFDRVIKGERITEIKEQYVVNVKNSSTILGNDLLLDVSGIECNLSYMFMRLIQMLNGGDIIPVELTDNSMSLRCKYDESVYKIVTFNFSARSLSNGLVREYFNEFVDNCRKKYPKYKENVKNEKYAKQIAGIAYYNSGLNIDNIKSLEEFRNVYNDNKKVVEAVLYQKMIGNLSNVNDVMLRLSLIIIIDLLLCFKVSPMFLLPISALLFVFFGFVRKYVLKVVPKEILEKKVNAAFKECKDRIFYEFTSTKDISNETIEEKCLRYGNTIVCDIKSDMLLIGSYKYNDYQEDLNILNDISVDYLKLVNDDITSYESMTGIKNILHRLIDIENRIYMKLGRIKKEGYAAKILREVEGVSLEEMPKLAQDDVEMGTISDNYSFTFNA